MSPRSLNALAGDKRFSILQIYFCGFSHLVSCWRWGRLRGTRGLRLVISAQLHVWIPPRVTGEDWLRSHTSSTKSFYSCFSSQTQITNREVAVLIKAVQEYWSVIIVTGDSGGDNSKAAVQVLLLISVSCGVFFFHCHVPLDYISGSVIQNMFHTAVHRANTGWHYNPPR